MNTFGSLTRGLTSPWLQTLLYEAPQFFQLDTLFKIWQLWCISCSLSIAPNPISRPDTIPGHFQWYVGRGQLWASCPPPLLSRGHLLFSQEQDCSHPFTAFQCNLTTSNTLTAHIYCTCPIVFVCCTFPTFDITIISTSTAPVLSPYCTKATSHYYTVLYLYTLGAISLLY